MICRIRAVDWAAIDAHVRAAYPDECCGLLVGVVRDRETEVEVTRVVAMDNVAPPPRRRRFEIDPRQQFALMRELRGDREAIVGHYHSHPDGAAEPSQADRDGAHDPALVWVIVGIKEGAIEARAYRPGADGSFAGVELNIAP